MNSINVCVHTNDKQYCDHQLEKSNLSMSLQESITHTVKENLIALNNRVWTEKKLYWRLDSNFRFIDRTMTEKLIRDAFLEASIQTPLIISQRRKETADAHMIINCLGKKDEKYFSSESILAYGWGPSGGLGGDITFNDDALWLLRKTPLLAIEAKALGYIDNFVNPNNQVKFYDPVHTAKHEGGHALGMRHIDSINEKLTAVMYPYYNGLRKFGDADLAYLVSLYGKSSLSHEIKEYLRNKIQVF